MFTNRIWISCLVLALGFASTGFADEFAAKFKKAKTPEECQAILSSPQVQEQPTAVMRPILEEYVGCAKRQMSQALDQRLLKLKKSNPTQFKNEMALQKTFNEAVAEHCGRWDAYYQKCENGRSTGTWNERNDCDFDFFAYRAKQAGLMNQKKFTV